MANPILKQQRASGTFFVVPGVQDMIATAMTNKVASRSSTAAATG